MTRLSPPPQRPARLPAPGPVRSPRLVRTAAAWLLALAGLPGLAAAAGQAHVHGVVALTVAVDGPQLSIGLATPLDNLLGFERAPRTAAERQAAASLLASLRQAGQPLFVPDAEAGCSPSGTEVQAPVLEPAAQAAAPAGGQAPAKARPAAGPGPAGHHHQDHAELNASFSFQCRSPAALRGVQTRLFEAYPRIQRLEVVVAGPQGQSRQLLKRPQGRIVLAR